MEDIDIYDDDKNQMVKVFVNGDWIGYTENTKNIIKNVKKGRIPFNSYPYIYILEYYFKLSIYLYR